VLVVGDGDALDQVKQSLRDQSASRGGDKGKGRDGEVDRSLAVGLVERLLQWCLLLVVVVGADGQADFIATECDVGGLHKSASWLIEQAKVMVEVRKHCLCLLGHRLRLGGLCSRLLCAPDLGLAAGCVWKHVSNVLCV
jgi:hypothetical protein